MLFWFLFTVFALSCESVAWSGGVPNVLMEKLLMEKLDMLGGDVRRRPMSPHSRDKKLSSPSISVAYDDLEALVSESEEVCQSFPKEEMRPFACLERTLLDIQGLEKLNKQFYEEIGGKTLVLRKIKGKRYQSKRFKESSFNLLQRLRHKSNREPFVAKLLEMFRKKLDNFSSPKTTQPIVQIKSQAQTMMMGDMTISEGRWFLARRCKLCRRMKRLAFMNKGRQNKGQSKQSAQSKKEQKKRLEMSARFHFGFMCLNFWFRFLWGA